MDRRTKKVSLDFMGEGWKDCYIELYYLTWADAKKIMELDDQHEDDWVAAMVGRIQRLFVSGKVLDKGQMVDLTNEAIHEFDVDALRTINNHALGIIDPKDSPDSAPPSS